MYHADCGDPPVKSRGGTDRHHLDCGINVTLMQYFTPEHRQIYRPIVGDILLGQEPWARLRFILQIQAQILFAKNQLVTTGRD